MLRFALALLGYPNPSEIFAITMDYLASSFDMIL
jgi:hypothetical protein